MSVFTFTDGALDELNKVVGVASDVKLRVLKVALNLELRGFCGGSCLGGGGWPGPRIAPPGRCLRT